jgi:hypothetical protein
MHPILDIKHDRWDNWTPLTEVKRLMNKTLTPFLSQALEQAYPKTVNLCFMRCDDRRKLFMIADKRNMLRL